MHEETLPSVPPAVPSTERGASLPWNAGVVELVEAVLKHPQAVDAGLLEPRGRRERLARLLGIALFGFTLHAALLAITLHLAGSVPFDLVPPVRWGDGSFLGPLIAYPVGFVAALGICLPSFYFYGLLANVKTSMIESMMHGVKSLAVGAVTLVGVLPAYFALVLIVIAFELSPTVQVFLVFTGLFLPFAAGLNGLRSLHGAFLELARQRHGDTVRTPFLARLLFSWAGVYTAVAPVMILTLWKQLSV